MIDIEAIDFGGNVRRIRKTRGLTCSDIDRLAGLSNSYTNKIEHQGADSNPTMVNALLIANVLDVSIMDLLATPQDSGTEVAKKEKPPQVSPPAEAEPPMPAADKPAKQGGNKKAFKKLKELTAERIMADEMACLIGKGYISSEERLELKRTTSKLINEVIRLYKKGELG